jgi:hypothetical protein
MRNLNLFVLLAGGLLFAGCETISHKPNHQQRHHVAASAQGTRSSRAGADSTTANDTDSERFNVEPTDPHHASAHMEVMKKNTEQGAPPKN